MYLLNMTLTAKILEVFQLQLLHEVGLAKQVFYIQATLDCHPVFSRCLFFNVRDPYWLPEITIFLTGKLTRKIGVWKPSFLGQIQKRITITEQKLSKVTG